MRDRVVYLTTNALGEPHVVSQVLPYLERAAPPGGVELVTFEKTGTLPAETAAARARVERARWRWSTLPHRRPPIGPLLALAQGTRLVTRLAGGRRDMILHARSYVAAAIAARAARKLRAPWIFDMRGFYLDERIDAGLLRRGSLDERLWRSQERKLLRRADHVVVLTERAKETLLAGELGKVFAPITVVPCCVDLDAFTPAASSPRPPVLAYTGTLGGGYLEASMARFAANLRAHMPDLEMIIASRQPTAGFEAQLRTEGFGARQVRTMRLAPTEVPKVLQTASAGIILVRPSFAKRAASPIKIGEYLASGLPVVASVGCGDVPELLRRERVGVTVDPMDEGSLAEGAVQLSELLLDPGTPARCRRAAEAHLSLDLGGRRYADVYAEVANL